MWYTQIYNTYSLKKKKPNNIYFIEDWSIKSYILTVETLGIVSQYYNYFQLLLYETYYYTIIKYIFLTINNVTIYSGVPNINLKSD